MAARRRDTRRALKPLPILLTAVLLACSGPATSRSTSDPSVAGPVARPISGQGPTLRLPLFVDGEVVSVRDGKPTLVARWPSPTAPYEPPVVVPGGFVGLSGDGLDLALWFVAPGGNRLVVPPPLTQGFGVSAGGTSVVVGRADLSRVEGSTRLVMLSGKRFRRVSAETTLPNTKGTAGAMIGTDVFVQTGDAGGVGVELWHTASGSVTPLPAHTDAGPVDPSNCRVVLFQGDGGCWAIATWPQRGRPSSSRTAECGAAGLAFSPDGTMLAGISGSVADRRSGGRGNRVMVFDAGDTTTVFTSPTIPGAVQVAWESASTLLVLARERGDEAIVTRCDIDRRTCERVWSVADGGKRYGVWLVVTPPGGLRRSPADPS